MFIYLYVHRFHHSIRYNRTTLHSLGFDELRNVVRFLSIQADDNEDLEGNDILENGSIKPEQNAVSYEKVPKVD